jgi:phosphatidate cytidylyltransferase
MDESGASALPSAPADRERDVSSPAGGKNTRSPGNLWARIASSAILVPLALIAVYLGAPWFGGLVAISVAGMAWEWGRLTGWAGTWRESGVLMVLGASAVLVAELVSVPGGIGLAMAGALALFALGRDGRPAPLWMVGGLLWIILPAIGLISIRLDPAWGLATTAWVLALVWSVDTAAYIVGKTVGGPRLASRISPTKTWSGLAGGVAGAAIVGLIAAQLSDASSTWRLVAISAVLAIVEQIGDIAESYAKRHFGVKDSSDLIPGHGGLLDRLDGMLAVAVIVAIFEFMTGESVLTWQ